MRDAVHRTAVTLLICLTFSGSVYAYRQAADEAALHSLGEKFFTAFRQQDLNTLMLLWSEKSPDYAASRKSFQESFAANKIELKGVTIGRLSLDGDKASLRVVVDSSAIDLKTYKPATGFGKLARTLHFVKEGGGWKVWRYVASEEELAAALAAARTDEERKALLEADIELQTSELVRTLNDQGTRLRARGNYPQAVAVLQLSLTTAQRLGYQAGMAGALRNLGIVSNSQGNYSQALDYFHKSLTISEELSDKAGIAASLNALGATYQLQGDYAKALESYRQSVKTREEAGNRLGNGGTLSNIGTIHLLQGNFTEALNGYHQSLKILEEVGDKPNIANTLTNIGLAHKSLGNYAQALEHYQKALNLAEALGIKPTIATLINNMGLVYKARGDYPQALESYRKSLKIREEIGDRAGIATTFATIGTLHLVQGSYTQALAYYQKCLTLREELGDQAGIAGVLSNLGAVLHVQGNYSQAVEYYLKGLQFTEKAGRKVSTAVALNNLGNAYLEQGNPVQALEYFQRSLQINQETGKRVALASTLLNIAYAHQAQGHHQKTLETSNQATAMAMGDPEVFWGARTLAGQTYRALNQPDLAQQAFAEAIAAIEDLRNRVAGNEQQQQQFFESKISPYYEMVDLLISQKRFQEAFTFAERSKSRVLFDVLSLGKINLTKALSDEEQRQERNLNAELVSLNSQLYEEKQRNRPDQTRLAEFTARLEKVRLQIEAFHADIYAAHPELRVQRGEIRPLSATESAALIPDRKTALLEFVVQKHRTSLFVLTRNPLSSPARADLQTYQINLGQKELADLTRRFTRSIGSRSLGFRKPAAELYNLLLKPAQAQLRGITNLVIVPDDVLWELPFQALLSNPKRFLLEDYAISYAPSLTVLKEMNSLQAKRINDKGRTKTLLALGNPAFGAENAEKLAAIFMGEKLLPLPEAERQVKVLEQLYGRKNSRVYTGSEASEARLKQEAGDYRVLHLATHGILNDASPMYSHLVLSQLQGKTREDGLLEAWEIMQLDLNADLVILSACDTARGRVGAGEGMIGLAWSLFVAGSPTTVVSQWKVETESNSELMIAFHRNLGAGTAATPMSKAQALRQAALKLKRNRQYNHPFYWAPFVIIGDAR
jgi:CHAT domain-containing protein/Tfp pilus assembly protein PilF